MAVSRVTSRTWIPAAAKATVRYIKHAHRRQEEQSDKPRQLFGRDGEPLTKAQAYRMIDRAGRNTTSFRIALSPDRKGEDTYKDLDLQALTEVTMMQLQDLFPNQNISYIAGIHTNTDNRHVHILADADFSDRYLQSSWSTLTGDMDPVITEKVIRSVAGSDFSAEDILLGREAVIAGIPTSQPVTVYLRFPEHRLHALAPLIRLIWSSLLDELIALYDSRKGHGCFPVLALLDEAGTSPVPALPRYAATDAGRGISLVVLVQDHNQLEAAYGRHGAVSLINNMETQLYYGQSGLDISEYIEKRMGRKSEYAHSKTMHGEQETAEGESEQAVPLVTVQDITELPETEILGIHRNLKPFRVERMDWRLFPNLVERTKLAPPQLPTLPPVSDHLPPLVSPTGFVDLDGPY